jgi:hypothetical protein
MSGLALFADPRPPVPAGIDLRLADVADVLPTVSGAALVHADPPWTYNNTGTEGAAAGEYALLTDAGIAAHIDAAYDCAAEDAYLVLWTTWPKLTEWLAASAAMRWTYKTGGCWGKSGRLGVGFHWRGDSEPVLVYTKGSPRPADRTVSNLHVSQREAHSEKPTAWLRRMLAAFSPPGGLVLDVYAGLGPMARACALEGRRYVGAEIDPDRHAKALGLLAGVR